MNLKSVGDGFYAPLGRRVFSPDDWIVRLTLLDGTVRVVGVQPEVSEEGAINAATTHCLVHSSGITNVDVMRRRTMMKTQVQV